MTTAAAASVRSTPAPATPPLEGKSLNALLHLPAEMELSQIELIYRAEGNANLVLALPQFKKVLRLPKMISSSSRSCCQQPTSADQPEGQQPSASDPSEASSSKAGVLTMPDFMAYIEIMRRLLGNEFVCAADIVAIPKESDRCWINEHIRQHRPVSRLDKEFVGPFGLLLPDVTQLPATFDVLLANLQAKDMNMDTDMDADICSSSSSRGSSRSRSSGCCGVSRLGDTYAIEIKPKQGWLQLPSDVSDLFDLMPTGDGTMDPTCEPEPQPEPQAEPQPEKAKQKVRPTVDSLLKPDKCRCRYCSMQLVKLQMGKIKRLGQYCPLHLFSGAPGRMVDALDALFACPQNNLRVFQSGNLIYGDHANSISCEQLHTQLFPGEIMALIKHLLVACLLREYSQEEEEAEEQEEQQQVAHESHSHVAVGAAAFGKSTFKRCGMKTKPSETIEIGRAEHVAELLDQRQEEPKEPCIVDFVKAVAGQPQRRTAAAAAASPRYTKRTKMATATETATQTTMSANVATRIAMATATATATATGKETETETTSTALATLNSASPLTPSPIQARISKAEIFHLPKNCVLQKILHLQLLVKRHFHYMWAQGYGQHATPSYQALRALLASCQRASVEELPAEQAYMLGATALDCSIMLTFQEVQCPAKHHSALQPWLVTLEGRQFLTKLSILDLDPKPDSHFHKYIKQTRLIEKSCGALD